MNKDKDKDKDKDKEKIYYQQDGTRFPDDKYKLFDINKERGKE